MMNAHARRRCLSLASALVVALLASPGAQAQITVGLAPFTDATASGNRSAGADVARTLQAEHATSLVPRLLEDVATPVDVGKVLAAGRGQHVDLIFVGTVLEAKTEQSNRRGWLPSIKGQSASLDVHHEKATVILQGELYDAASGERLFSTRVTGSDSSNALGGSAYTTLGSFGNDSYQSFLESPLGKALRNAVSDMAKHIAAARPPRP
jgi:hypothetical protein